MKNIFQVWFDLTQTLSVIAVFTRHYGAHNAINGHIAQKITKS